VLGRFVTIVSVPIIVREAREIIAQRGHPAELPVDLANNKVMQNVRLEPRPAQRPFAAAGAYRAAAIYQRTFPHPALPPSDVAVTCVGAINPGKRTSLTSSCIDPDGARSVEPICVQHARYAPKCEACGAFSMMMP
jgi:hypothetical protein